MPSFSQKKQPQILNTSKGVDIAYHALQGKSPGVIFLGGFHSDMDGTKAVALDQWCQDNGRAFLRFDYSGHGASSGQFEDGCIGDWAIDALSALDHLTQGPQVLVGSSMGGWISLLVAHARPERIVGLLGVAAAPDFTEDLMWSDLNAAQRAELNAKGKVCLPCDYDPGEPYVITKKLIEDGKNNLLLRGPLNINIPVRLIQGMQDADVPWKTALKLQDVLTSGDVEIQFVKNGDHRLSEAKDLLRLTRTLDHLLKDVENA
ncbi:MAG: alpha/beta hydrolase [Rhodospirillaceae bacterium]|nr:MAG: alpha/beta hydrolase [Rhodospirillaceae bacterium]